MKGGDVPIQTQLDLVNGRLAKAVEKIQTQAAGGVVLAALWVKREAMKLCPVVTGNLRSSAFVTGLGQPAPIATFVDSGPGGVEIDKDKMQERHQEVVAESTARVAAAPASRPLSEVGFTAIYARRTHENPLAGKTGGETKSTAYMERKRIEAGSTEITYSRVGQWQFLATPLRRRKQILGIIAGEVTF